MKRFVDLVISCIGLILFSPVLACTIAAIWIQDWNSPFYKPYRAGLGGRVFRMIKLRTMIANADSKGGSSTAANDRRITPIGQIIRRYKLDEFVQLWNVLIGDMSLVGPRPNLKDETDLYTSQEGKLLTVKPGITDFSSIVFADEGEILKNQPEPDVAYNQLIRPWKSRLGIFYVENHSLFLDIRLIALTVLAIVNRRRALDHVQTILRDMGAPEALVRVAGRHDELLPHPPPGMAEVVTLKPASVTCAS